MAVLHLRTGLLAALLLLMAHLPASAAGWLPNVEDALARARAEQKLVFLEIAGTRNSPNQRLDDGRYQHAGLKSTLASFVTVRLDGRTAPDKWDHAGALTLIVLQADGKEIARPTPTLDAPALAARLEELLADERALTAARGKLATAPEDTPSLLTIARLSLRRNDPQAAGAAIETLSRSTNPEARAALPRLYLGMGMALGKGGPSPKGIPYFERVVQEFPTTKEAEQANLILGMAYTMQGDRAAATRSLEKVLETTSDNYLRERATRELHRIAPKK